MSAISRPLLCAFAGGCLSNAVLFGLWRAADGMGASPAQQQHRSHEVAQLVATTTAAPSVELATERVASNAPEQVHEAASAPATEPAAQDLDAPGPTPAGSAVSDVLMGLEAAYRNRVAAVPSQRSATDERATVPAAMPAAEPPVSNPAQPVTEVSAVLPVAATAALEPRSVAAGAVDPPPVAPPPVAPPIAAAPAFAAEAPPPTEIHYGDINQNTYNITNVRQGDVYLIQLQQLAMLQYMQLLGMSPGVAAPARHAGGVRAQRTAFPSGITNPDNPWGFHFAPQHLVR